MHTPQSQSASDAQVKATHPKPMLAKVVLHRWFMGQAASLMHRQPWASPGGWHRWFAPQVHAPVAQLSGAQPSGSAFAAPTSQWDPAAQVEPSLQGAVSQSPLAAHRLPTPHEVTVHGV